MICPTCNQTPQSRGFSDNGKLRRYWCKTCNKWYRVEITVVEEPAKKEPTKPSIFFFDIETLPIEFWGWMTGEQYVRPGQIMRDWCVLSWAGMWLEDEEPVSDYLTVHEAPKRDDKRILTSLWKHLNAADIVVAHNGNGFDIPKVRGRWLKHSIKNPSPFKSIDTLQVARSQFKLSSNSLNFLLEYLGFEGKIHTDEDLWKKCNVGNVDALKEMDTYCRGDVTKLREVYMALRPYMTNHPNVNLWKEEQDGHCPTCGSTSISVGGSQSTMTYLYDAYQCENCGAWHRSRKKKSLI